MVSKKNPSWLAQFDKNIVFSPVYKGDPKLQTMQTVQTELGFFFLFYLLQK